MITKIVREDGSTLENIKSCTFTETVNSTQEFKFGSVSAASIEVFVYDTQDNAVTAGEKLTYYQVDEDGVETKIGLFYPAPTIATKSSYSFMAYDSVAKLDTDFSERLTEIQDDFPMSMLDLLEEAASIAGVVLSEVTQTALADSMSVQAFTSSNITCRQIFSWAAEITGLFVVCNVDGEIDFKSYVENETDSINANGADGTIYKQDGLQYENYTTQEVARVAIYPVWASASTTNAYIYPTEIEDGNTYAVSGNLLLTGATESTMMTLAESLYTKLGQLGVYRPFSCQLFPFKNPFRAGQIINVTDIQGVTFKTLVMSMQVSADGALLSSTGNETFANNVSLSNQVSNLYSGVTTATETAMNARELARSVSQHFWVHPTTGVVYVTSEPQESFLSSPSGRALLVTSDGLLLETVSTEGEITTENYLASFLGSGISLYNNNEVIASFTSSLSRIGGEADHHLSLTPHRLSLYDGEEGATPEVTSFFTVGDHREFGNQFKGVTGAIDGADVEIPFATEIISCQMDGIDAPYTLNNPGSEITWVTVEAPSGATEGDIWIEYSTGNIIPYIRLWPDKDYQPPIGSISLGYKSTNNGVLSYTEGIRTVADGKASHAEGNTTIAMGWGAHAEGMINNAYGIGAHAEGNGTLAGDQSSWTATDIGNSGNHAEGIETAALGGGAHAEGVYSVASNYGAHASGEGTIAASMAQTAIGKWNVADETDTYAFIIGNGDGDEARSNAFVVAWDGSVGITNNTYSIIPVTRGSSPSVTTYRSYAWNDSVGNRLAQTECTVTSNGQLRLNMYVCGHHTQSNQFGGFYIFKEKDNTGNETMTYNANTGLLSAKTFSGNGASLTSLNAGNISSGTLAVARGGTGNTSVDTIPTSGSTKMVTSGGIYNNSWMSFSDATATVVNAQIAKLTANGMGKPCYCATAFMKTVFGSVTASITGIGQCTRINADVYDFFFYDVVYRTCRYTKSTGAFSRQSTLSTLERTWSISTRLVANGYVSSGNTQICFPVYLPGSIPKEGGTPTVKCTALKVNVRSVAGAYIVGSTSYVSGGYNVLGDSNYTVTVEVPSPHCVTLIITKKTALNVTNNTPVSVEIDALTLTFTY